MNRTRYTLAETLVAAILAVVVAGCNHPADQPSPGAGLRAAEVTDSGGIDDRSFNASAWAGLKRAAAEGGVQAKYLESSGPADYKTNLAALADDGNVLVFAVGYLMEDSLREVAPLYPKVHFAIIDGSAPNLPNCMSLKFREEQGAFLAGYLAGETSRTGTIGFVGGMEGPLMKRFEVGYTAGARTAHGLVRVLAKYVGSWSDLPKGRETGEAELRQGADIVFAAAGKSGLGALDAVSERGKGFYGIGVDADQDGLHPGRILTSVMKGVDAAVYTTVTRLKAGKWIQGEQIMGIKEDGVHLSKMQYTRALVSAEVLKHLSTVSEQISKGTLVVPKTDQELARFHPPAL